jgi:ATP-dependent exoDNAse (exonuclease V) beta subunit
MPLEMTRLELGRQREKILIGSALLLVNNFLSSQFFAELLDNGPIALESEVPFIMRWENPEPILLRGSIDLLLRYRNCTRVIDFKTDAYRQPEQHEAQLEIYGEAAKRLYDLPVYTDLFYLRGVENWFSLRRDSLQQQ